jgi:hypothetical protein
LMQPVLPEALQASNNTEPNGLSLLTAMLYGGITEEILMRWGLFNVAACLDRVERAKTRRYVAKSRDLPGCDRPSRVGIWTTTPASDCRDRFPHSGCDYSGVVTEWDCGDWVWLALLAILA